MPRRHIAAGSLVSMLVLACDPEPQPNPPAPAPAPASPAALSVPIEQARDPSPEPPPAPAAPAAAPTPAAHVRAQVDVRVLRFQANAEREQIVRLVEQLATPCLERELAKQPETAGTLTLEFAVAGDRKGPKSLKITGESKLPSFSRCLRRKLDGATWPTNYIDGIGLIALQLELSSRPG